ncbi:MAG: class I SAM-dependent methyltransferase [Candidatus Woesearchaeota archaeon]
MKMDKGKFDNYHKKSKIAESRLPFLWLKIVRKFPFLNEKINLILKLPKKAKILDVGCGLCTFLKYVHTIRPDIKLFGIDVSSGIESRIPNFIEFKKASGDKIPYKDNTFDLVICQHVLEHVQNPEDFAMEIKRVTKEHVIIAVPNFRKTFLWDSANFWSDYTHVKPFTKTSLHKLLESCGFRRIKLKDTREINISLLGIILLIPVNIFWRKFKFSILFANIFNITTVGIARK